MKGKWKENLFTHKVVHSLALGALIDCVDVVVGSLYPKYNLSLPTPLL